MERYIICQSHGSEGDGCGKVFKIINDNGNKYILEHQPVCPERVNRYIDEGKITTQKKIEYIEIKIE